MKSFFQLRESLVYNDICPECMEDPCVCGGNHIDESAQLDEISSKTMHSYKQQAHTQVQHSKFGGGKDKPGAAEIVAKREKGMATATSKLQKKEKERIAALPKRTPTAQAPYKPLGGRDEVSGRSYSEEVEQGVAEESELGDLAHQKTLKHRVLVTYSDPNHTSVSMRKEKMQKHVLVPSSHKGESVYTGEAEILAKKYMKKKGYRVHGTEHVGLVSKKVTEETLDELSKETLQSYVNKVATGPSRGKTQTGVLKSVKAISNVAKAIGKQYKGSNAKKD